MTRRRKIITLYHFKLPSGALTHDPWTCDEERCLPSLHVVIFPCQFLKFDFIIQSSQYLQSFRFKNIEPVQKGDENFKSNSRKSALITPEVSDAGCSSKFECWLSRLKIYYYSRSLRSFLFSRFQEKAHMEPHALLWSKHPHTNTSVHCLAFGLPVSDNTDPVLALPVQQSPGRIIPLHLTHISNHPLPTHTHS